MQSKVFWQTKNAITETTVKTTHSLLHNSSIAFLKSVPVQPVFFEKTEMMISNLS